MSITFEQVSFTYPGTTAGVREITLTVGEGELAAIIGASGSGKTTLLKLMAGILRPDTGAIYLGGREITHLPVRERELGIVFQSYALFPHMSVWQNVAYPLRVRKIPSARRRTMAEEILERVGLAGMGERRPGTLSGGQQQRVALARALIFQPRALLLDEPLSALDAGLREEMRDEIRRIQQAFGIATLHITHDQEEALSMADRVAVMHQGRILQAASPQEIYDRPVSRRVAAFVGRANLWEAVVEASDTVAGAMGRLHTAPHDFAPGTRVIMLIRPEAVEIGPGADPVNTRTGTLARDRFLGPVRHFDLRIRNAAGAVTLSGETARRDEITTVYLPPDRIRLIPADHP